MMQAMGQVTTLPIGVDVGSKRVRACAIVRCDGLLRVERVSTVDIVAGDVEAALGAAIRALDSREKRCVLAARPPDATLWLATFPPMRSAERERAAAFSVRDGGDARAFVTRVRAFGADTFACGSIARAALDRAVARSRRVGMRPVAIDFEAFAWRRAAPNADAVLDVGAEMSRLMVFGSHVPEVSVIPIGGDAFTQAMQNAIGIDAAQAEDRKRESGLGSCGLAEMQALAARVFEIVTGLRARGFADVRTLMLGGNGSRIVRLSDILADALGCTVVREDRFSIESAYPPDVFRAASADWSVAIGLALYGSVA